MSINLNFIDINKSAKEANYPSETPTNLVSKVKKISLAYYKYSTLFCKIVVLLSSTVFSSFEWARKLIFHSQNKLCRIQSTVSFLLEKSYVIVSQICVTYDISQNKLE